MTHNGFTDKGITFITEMAKPMTIFGMNLTTISKPYALGVTRLNTLAIPTVPIGDRLLSV